MYTIGTERNSYFEGRDGVLYKDGKRIATIALKDARPAIKVKVYSWGTDATRELRDDLGEERIEAIIENIIHDFWYHLAPETVQENGHYSDVWGAGRSGGWCIPYAEHRDNDWRWWEETTIDAPFETDKVDDMSTIDARRWWFFEAAEAITAEVEYLRTEHFDEAVRDAHYELEQRREAYVVRGDN
jgi:hypothetical protein